MTVILQHDHIDKEIQSKLAQCKEAFKVFERAQTQGQQVRARVTWRNTGDTMLVEFFNVVKDKSQASVYKNSRCEV